LQGKPPPTKAADLVHAANLALHFAYMSGLDEIPEMMACATSRGAKTLGVEDEYGIEEGKPVHAPLPRGPRGDDHVFAAGYWRVRVPTAIATSCVLLAVTVRGSAPCLA